MPGRIAFFIADFWYPFLGYIFGTSYLLLLINFFRRRVILINVLIFIMLVWQIGFIFEGYFRYVYDQSDNFNFLLTSQRWEQRHVKDLNQLMGEDQFRDSKNWREPKQPGGIKIAVVGDSIAYGVGIESPRDRFPDLLEAGLNQAGVKAKVYNLSHSGDDLPQAQINFDMVLDQGDFDLIIWQLFPNDLPSGVSPDVTKIKNLLHGQTVNPLLKDLLDSSYAFNFFYFHIWGLKENIRGEHLHYQLEAYRRDDVWLPAERQMIAMIESAAAKRVGVIAVLFPYLELVGPEYPVEIHAKLAGVFRQKNVTVIDLLERFQENEPEKLMANRFDSHPGEPGHRLAADAILEKVQELYRSN